MFVTTANIVSGLALAAVTVSGAAIQARDWINHDAVVGFDQTVPDTTAGKLYLKYKPWLKVSGGCVPFPSVDKDGNLGSGLKTGGAANGHCSSSTGQVYARGKEYNGMYAIMYSWYWPKDNPSPAIGHRHDWESVVVWVASEAEDAAYKGIAASAHGKYNRHKAGDDAVGWDGDRPLIDYGSQGLDNSLDFTFNKGGEQPLIAWESLPQAAQDALSSADFGKANVPFKDANFDNNLEKAKV